MNYSLIREMDISNGPGVRVSLFCSGCEFHCKNCFNQSTWDFNHGSEFTQHEVDDIIDLLKRPYISGLSILGGEPLAPQNIDNTIYILSKIRERFKDIKILLWTGYSFKDIKKDKQQKKILKLVNKIIDGKYIEELRDTTLELRGSSNQNIINLDKY